MQPGRLSLPQRAILSLLLVAGFGLLGWSAVRYFRKPVPVLPQTIDLAQDVKNYLDKKNVRPLSEPLKKILADDSFTPEKTQPHPLLNHKAPDFKLVDPAQNPWSLADLTKNGPVVVVFYYGYHCNHCVGQLFAVNNDLSLFKEVGASVIAVSADPPDLTRERFKKYGAFGFPVVSDPGNVVAAKFGLVKKHPGKDDDLAHGTFLIDRNGIVRWANFGDEPFTDNRTLLKTLSTLE